MKKEALGMNIKTNMKLPEKVTWILDRLSEHGYEAYAVGGCVRDSWGGSRGTGTLRPRQCRCR